MNTEQWTSRIDRITDSFMQAFGTLTVEQLNWKPDSATWSVGQNVDHLMVINKTYEPVIRSIRRGTHRVPWIGKVPFIVRLIGKGILNSVHPDRRRKMKTFPIWEPASSQIAGDILDRFKAHQEELKQWIRDSADLLDANVVISSPANKYIVYTLATAFDIIVTHEERHLAQARELYQMMRNE